MFPNLASSDRETSGPTRFVYLLHPNSLLKTTYCPLYSVLEANGSSIAILQEISLLPDSAPSAKKYLNPRPSQFQTSQPFFHSTTTSPQTYQSVNHQPAVSEQTSHK